MTTKRDGQPKSQVRNHIASSVYAAADARGIADRELIEQSINEVIKRLEQGQEQAQALPGWENLVAQKNAKTNLPPAPHLQAMIKDTLDRKLAEKETPHLVIPTPTTPLPVNKPASASKDVPERTAHPDEQETETIDREIKEILNRKSTEKEIPPQPTITSKIPLTENARHVLEKRYLKKDVQGKAVESPEDMLLRVAKTIAAAELLYNPKVDVQRWGREFYQAMSGLTFLPNSPTLMNAGRELGQLSACFVLPVEDSMESIFDAVKYTALIHKSGGGTGFSFSRLRPEKDRVGSTGGVASGPVSFMRAFDTATDVIKQGGMRRGANMGILNIDHPDILRFIDAKEESGALTNFNLSVAINARFMEAVQKGEDYDLINPHNRTVAGKLNAREVFDKIVNMAWRTGDPGIIFLDRINRDNPTPHLGAIESTNPCGEQPLLPYESCNLGSINLVKALRSSTQGGYEVDYVELDRIVKLAVRFLDDVIDVNRFPLPQIAEKTRATRKVGLGVMGFADMLLMLGVPYNSDEALRLGGDLMRFIDEKALETSMELARERGSFPAFKGSIYDVSGTLQVRNATRTTIAPTGTLSIIAGCSSGIEPLFALSYVRNILDGEKLIEVNPYFEEVARKRGFYSMDLMQKLASGDKLSQMEGIPEDVKRVFVTAHDVAPEWHVKMQATFQKHTNNAVSKTVNFPHDATEQDIANVYIMAYKEGVKGITVYRDGSKEGQVLSTTKPKSTTAAKDKTEAETGLTPRTRPQRTSGSTYKVTTGCGNIYVTVNSDEHGICEVFSSLGKAGGCASAQLEATCRLISLALRSGVDINSIIKHLRGIRCPSLAWEDGRAVLSCADAIGSVLEKHVKPPETLIKTEKAGHAAASTAVPTNMAGLCPECGSQLIYQEGCYLCSSCGYTKCG